jgi:hypothetical protein
MPHVIDVFVSRDRPEAKGALRDGLQEFLFPSRLDPCLDEVAHDSGSLGRLGDC